MEDDKGLDDKVLALPLHDPGWNTLESLDQVSDRLQNEIAHFFSIGENLENKHIEVKGWFSLQDTVDEIRASRARFKDAPAH
jgi:inorganic pyrophosphatase